MRGCSIALRRNESLACGPMTVSVAVQIARCQSFAPRRSSLDGDDVGLNLAVDRAGTETPC